MHPVGLLPPCQAHQQDDKLTVTLSPLELSDRDDVLVVHGGNPDLMRSHYFASQCLEAFEKHKNPGRGEIEAANRGRTK